MPSVDLKTETRLSAYGALIQFAKAMGNDSLALQVREEHEDVLYELMKQIEKHQLYRVWQQYDYEKLQNMMHVKQAYTQRIIAIILVLMFGVIVFVLYSDLLCTCRNTA